MPIGLIRAGLVCMGSQYTVEAGCATFGDVVGVLNAGVSVTLGKGIGVACSLH